MHSNTTLDTHVSQDINKCFLFDKSDLIDCNNRGRFLKHHLKKWEK